jgi:hypothetical protein
MKKLSQILENSEFETTDTNSPLIDNVGLVLSYLEQISEMADEIYNTVSQLSEVDAEAHTLIQNVYTNLDDAYSVIDNKYGIEPIGDFDEMEESYEVDESDILEESITKKDASKITAAQIEKYIDNQDFKSLGQLFKHLSKDEYKTWSANGYEGRTYELLMKSRKKNSELGEAAMPRQQAAGAERVQYGEEFDATKFKSFVNQTGLVSKENAADVITAMKALDSGKVLSTKQKDLINGMLMSLVGIITGDTSVFNKIKQSTKAE